MSVTNPSDDVKQAVAYTNLDFRNEVWSREIYLGLIKEEKVLKIIKLEMITRAVNIENEEHQ